MLTRYHIKDIFTSESPPHTFMKITLTLVFPTSPANNFLRTNLKQTWDINQSPFWKTISPFSFPLYPHFGETYHNLQIAPELFADFKVITLDINPQGIFIQGDHIRLRRQLDIEDSLRKTDYHILVPIFEQNGWTGT